MREGAARLDELAPDARHLAGAAMEVVDGWWDDEAALLWNPPRSFDEALAPRSVHMVPQTAQEQKAPGIANFSGGPLYAFCIDRTVRVPSRINATCVASLNSFVSAPLT